MEDQYDITFPVCGDSNVVEDIAAEIFKDTSNQRLRRGMEREVGSVWYDRLPKKVSQKGILNKYPVIIEKKELMVGMYRLRGYLVTRVQSNFLVPLNPGVPEEDQLKQALGTSTSYDEYMKKADSIWNQQKVCVRT